MWRRLILGTLTALLLSLLLIGGGIYALLASEAGSRYLLRQALPYAPGHLEIDAIHGALLKTLRLDGVRYVLDRQSVSMAHFSLSWRPWALLQARLDIRKVTADGVIIHYAAGEEEAASQPLAIRLPLEVSMHEIVVEDVTLTVDGQRQHVQRLHFGAHADARGLQLRQVQLQAEPFDVQLEASAALPEMRNIDAQVQWRYRDEKLGDVAGEGRLQGDLRQLQVKHVVVKPFKVTVQGPVKLDGATPEFDLRGQWQSVYWPLQEKAHYFSEQGAFRLHGTLEGYQAELSGSVRDLRSGPLHVMLNAAGSAAQLLISELRIDGKAGRLHSAGDISWQDGIGFNFAFEAEQLQVQPWLPDWPGYLNARLAVQGRVDGGMLTQATAAIERVDGKLRGYALAGSGQIASAGQRITLKQVRLSSGNNRVELDGGIGERLQLDFKLAAPQLAALWPGLEGALTSSGKIGGSPEQPEVDATLQGRNIGYEDFALKRIDARFNVDTRSGGSLEMNFEAKNLLLAGQKFAALRIAAGGSVQNHRLTLEMSGEPGNIKTTLQGGYRPRHWDGMVAAMELKAPPVGVWRLQQPAKLSVSFGADTEIGLSGFCLQQQNALLCSDGGYQGGKGYRASGLLANIPLALLRPLLPENLRLEGDIGGRYDLAGSRSAPTVKAAIDAQPGVVTLTDADNKQHRFHYRDTFVRVDGSGGTYNVRYALRIRDAAAVDGALRIDPQQRLAGQLRARVEDLTLLAALLPGVEKLTGRITADADIGGTLQQPIVKTELLFIAGEAHIPDLGLKLYDMRLHAASSDGRRLRIDGEIHSGPGKLTLNGTALLDAEQGWPLRLTIRGEQFQTVRLPEAEVWIEPNLLLRTAGAGGELTGTLLIPEAHIRLTQLPRTAVSVSEDQVIVGKDRRTAAAATATKDKGKNLLSMRVEVKLGDKVDFTSYGLKTELVGGIEVNNAQGVTAAYGEVQMRNGKYTAYRQNLTIERGRFVFAGAADNPNLDIRASRVSKTDQVTAILSVSGPMKAPLTQISSEPPLSQDQALAYLLTGRSFNSANTSERALLAEAALSYGLDYTQPFLQQLGIDEAGIESNGTLTGSSLVLGKYLTPDFYIGYVSNIFNSSAVVALRYRLSKSFSVETHTGTSHGLDFLYNLEAE